MRMFVLGVLSVRLIWGSRLQNQPALSFAFRLPLHFRYQPPAGEGGALKAVVVLPPPKVRPQRKAGFLGPNQCLSSLRHCLS